MTNIIANAELFLEKTGTSTEEEYDVIQSLIDEFSWKEIQTAPKDRRILVSYCDSENVFISQWSEYVQGSGFGIVDSCCGYYEDLEPDYWMDIPKTKL